jgi:hypothetical protein
VLPVTSLFLQSSYNHFAKVDFSIRHYRLGSAWPALKLTLASGATALGSALHSEIKTARQTEFPRNEIDNTISKKIFASFLLTAAAFCNKFRRTSFAAPDSLSSAQTFCDLLQRGF